MPPTGYAADGASTMAVDHYQNVIIGSGEAGKFLAWTLAQLGQKTAVVERSAMGGACPNVACLPSKNVIHSAKVASLVKSAKDFGITTGCASIDMAGVIRRKRQMVEGLSQLHHERFAASGAEFIAGEARFTEPKTLQVAMNDGGVRTLHGERVFLAVGTRASLPDVPGLVDAKPMTHVEALDLERLPAHLVILGGGYVGLEFAQALRRFGSRVTVIQHAAQLLGHEDPDVAEAVRQLMVDEGIEVLLRTEVAKVSGISGDRLTLEVRLAVSTSTIDATDLLVATGRTPNTDSLDAAKGGVELDARGYVRVNERLETSAPDVWAMGDCAGSPHFTHVSFDDHRIVRDNLAGGSRTTRDRLIPYCLFTDPELVHVGLSEDEAKAKGVRYRLAKLPMAAVMRTRTTTENRGFMKALVADSDRILGFTAFGAEASELLAAVQTAMIGKLPYTSLRDGIFSHPTIAEGLTVLFAKPPAAPESN
jgi:pyruvate/2-oxoglutarate dehydrogenase complex dihydrolipoamide dehydrogenase (E3) component